MSANLTSRLESILSFLAKGPVINLSTSGIILCTSGVAADIALVSGVLSAATANVCPAVGAVMTSPSIASAATTSGIGVGGAVTIARVATIIGVGCALPIAWVGAVICVSLCSIVIASAI